MKILIGFLLALFISSHAYAKETMKEHCDRLENDILTSYEMLKNQKSDAPQRQKYFTNSVINS